MHKNALSFNTDVSFVVQLLRRIIQQKKILCNRLQVRTAAITRKPTSQRKNTASTKRECTNKSKIRSTKRAIKTTLVHNTR